MVDGVSIGISAPPAWSFPARRARLALFIIIAGFMLAGPLIEQVVGMRTVFWRSWTMFSAIGLGVIDASFALRRADGTIVPLDRFATLDAPRDGKLRRIEDPLELAALIERLCASLGPGADLRVKARQAVRAGWRVIRTGEQNACAG